MNTPHTLPASFCSKPIQFVLFGATGDLSLRKLLPALYQLEKNSLLPEQFRCLAFARRDKDTLTYLNDVQACLKKYLNEDLDLQIWSRFSKRLSYLKGSFDDPGDFQKLAAELDKFEQGALGHRIFYLATSAELFKPLVSLLTENKVVQSHKNELGLHRVVLEKPFGYDWKSSQGLQNDLLCYLSEEQIYRIDHYLGKETVQNLLALRFSNTFFESFWNREHIDHIQITVAESIGIESRGPFFEKNGIMRDIAQNHMMQLLCLTAMSPPSSLDAQSIHQEKVKVLKALRPLTDEAVQTDVIRAQYVSGPGPDNLVKSYREEEAVDPHSCVETYFAMKLFVDTPRLSGVPFYLRTGKRLSKRKTEIAIIFKQSPYPLFNQALSSKSPNALVLRIQPNEGISFHLNCKQPGVSSLVSLSHVDMNFSYQDHFEKNIPDAYVRLIYDLIAKDKTLFAREDEVLESWKFFDPILHYWQSNPDKNLYFYPAGSEGPQEAANLMKTANQAWRAL